MLLQSATSPSPYGVLVGGVFLLVVAAVAYRVWQLLRTPRSDNEQEDD